MSIAGHVSRAMLSRYSHVRMEAKRRAADEKRKKEAEQTRLATVVSQFGGGSAISCTGKRGSPMPGKGFNARPSRSF